MTHGWVTPAVVGMPVPLWSWRWAGRHADPSTPPPGRAPGRLLQQYRPLCNSLRGTKQWAEPPGPSYCARSSGGSHNLSACNNNTQTIRRWRLRNTPATGASELCTHMHVIISLWGTTSCVIHVLNTIDVCFDQRRNCISPATSATLTSWHTAPQCFSTGSWCSSSWQCRSSGVSCAAPAPVLVGNMRRTPWDLSCQKVMRDWPPRGPLAQTS